MTSNELLAIVLSALSEVAPEANAETLAADVPFRDQVDLDSFDFLNFVIGLHKQTGVDVPETDYRELATLNGAVDYLSKRLKAQS